MLKNRCKSGLIYRDIKGAYPIYILDYLATNTDSNHRVSINEITNYLKRTFPSITLKTVRNNLNMLEEIGFDICYDDSIKRHVEITNKYGKTEKVLQPLKKDYYFNHNFSQNELHLIMESLLFSRQISQLESEELLDKLYNLQSRHFNPRLNKIARLTDDNPYDFSITGTLDIIDEAIEKGRKIRFNYGRYGVDKKFHLNYNDDKKTLKEYIVSPYRVAANNSKYYLICKRDENDELQHFRLDRMKNIEISEEAVYPLNKIKGYKLGINMNKYMHEHIYMFPGKSVTATFKVKNNPTIISEMLDFMGKDIKFKKIGDDEFTATITANETALITWAIQYCGYVTLLEPSLLRGEVKKRLKNAIEEYQK